MRGLSTVCAGSWLLPVVMAAAGCNADRVADESMMTAEPGACAFSAADTLTSVQAGPVMFDKGLVTPVSSLPCTALDTGMQQLNCTHDNSSLVALPDGSLAVAFYHGVGDKSLDSHLLWSRLAPGKSVWSAPEVLYDDPRRVDGSPALWLAADGALTAFFVTLYGSDWSDARPFVMRSRDGGTSWSAPAQLYDRCRMVSHRPLRLHSGDVLLPLHDSCLFVPAFLRSRDDGASWVPGKDVALVEHSQQIQPALIQRADGTVVAFTRDAADVSRIAQMSSTDDGVTWSPSRLTDLPSPAAAMDQLRLPSGHVVAVFNRSLDDRFPLSAALSLDEGRTFVALHDLLTECPDGPGKCAFTAPSIAYNPADGTLWVTYTHNQQTIGWVHFSEAWLAGGQDLATIRCTPGESCTANDRTCQRLCRNDLDCAGQAVTMQCATTGLCQPVCPSDRPAIAHCGP